MARRISTRQLQNQLHRIVNAATGRMTDAAITKIMSIGMTEAKRMAPMEYGTLINSAFRRIYAEGHNTVGIAGFAVSYAIYLHENERWNNVIPEEKDGPAWNPDGSPKFLEIGFSSDAQQLLMRRALSSSYRTPRGM